MTPDAPISACSIELGLGNPHVQSQGGRMTPASPLFITAIFVGNDMQRRPRRRSFSLGRDHP